MLKFIAFLKHSATIDLTSVIIIPEAVIPEPQNSTLEFAFTLACPDQLG
jgi:hypothetical protein